MWFGSKRGLRIPSFTSGTKICKGKIAHVQTFLEKKKKSKEIGILWPEVLKSAYCSVLNILDNKFKF